MAGWGLPVPEVLDVDGALGIVVLEDLGDLTLQEALRERRSTPAATSSTAQALDQLVVLQREAARGPAARALLPDRLRLREALLGAALLLEALPGGLPRSATSRWRTGPWSRTASTASAAEIASWPRVLCHRDFHSRNLMLPPRRALLDRLPGRAHGPRHLRPRVAAARLLRGRWRRSSWSDRAEEFRQKAVPGRGARHLPAPLRAHVRPAEPEGARARSATWRPCAGTASTCPTSRAPSTTLRRNLARHPELSGLRRALARHLEELRLSADGRASRTSARHVGEEVRVQGWLHNKRSSGKLQFLIVRDGSGFAQAVVAKAAVPAEAWDGGGEGGPGVLAGADGPGEGGQARAGRLRGGRDRPRASSRPSTTTRSRPRSTAPRS